MIEKDEDIYLIKQQSGSLIFRTSSFIADKGSVLHGGIYNREFSSVLASFFFSGAVCFFLVTLLGREIRYYLIFIVLVLGTFPFFRKFVFIERYLETVLNRLDGKAEISLCRLGRKVIDSFQLAEIKAILIDTKKIEVMNRDGIEFVERISAMHGTVIPGFGEEKVFYSLKLLLADGTERTIFAHSVMQDVISVHDQMKEFLKI